MSVLKIRDSATGQFVPIKSIQGEKGDPGYVEKIVRVREFSGEDYAKYKSAFVQTPDSALYNRGFAYGQPCWSIDVKANKLYVLAFQSTDNRATRPVGFRANRLQTGVIGAVEVNDDGTLGETVTDFAPTYPTWHFNPSNGSGLQWDSETYDQYGAKVYVRFSTVVEEQTRYWLGLAFIPNRDFCGIVSTTNDSTVKTDATCLLFEVNDLDWNPYVDGGMEKEFLIEEINTVPAAEKAAIIDETIQTNAETYNCLFGKKWACCGDSLTQYSGGSSHPDNPEDTGFITQIMRRTGVVGTNLGSAGKKWSSGTDGSFETGSAVQRVNTIVTNDQDYDIITFAFGTNSDVDGDGTVDDAPAYDGTMCAAIKWCIETLVAWKPTISIGIILPPKRADTSGGSAQMKTRGDLIRQVAEMYGVPVCDMWAESGINTLSYTAESSSTAYYYFSDGLHLNDNGKQQYAKRLHAFLRDIAPVY